MNGKETSLKLLNVSRMTAHEITLHLKDKDAARRGDLLSPSLSKQGEYLVWVYRQFLTSTIIPFLPDHEIDAAFEKTGAAWEELFAVLSTTLPDETYRSLVKAWRSANDALGAVLRREHKPPRSEELYAELERRLEQAAKDFSGGDIAKQVADVITPIFDKWDRNRLKPILDNTNEIKSYYNSFDRLNGLDKLDPRRVPLIRKAIEYSHKTPYPIVPLNRAPGKKNKPTLAKLAKIVWDDNPNDQAGFKSFECYKSALYDQAKEHDESFLWIAEADQSSSL